MLKSNLSHFNPLSVISVQLKKASAQRLKFIVSKPIVPLGLIAVLGLGSVGWLTVGAIAPQQARASTTRLSVALNRQTGESFQSFLRRAEAVARAAAQRSFDANVLVSDVAVTILGENEGTVVPILELEVSRQAWRNRPDPQIWATYLPNTDMLLGFDATDEAAQTQPGQPAATPTPSPTPSPGAPTIINVPGAPNRVIIPGQQQPGAAPQQPGAAPQQPGAAPQQPGAAPQQPGAAPQQPGAAPGTAAPNQQVPTSNPQQPSTPAPININIPGAPNQVIPTR